MTTVPLGVPYPLDPPPRPPADGGPLALALRALARHLAHAQAYRLCPACAELLDRGDAVESRWLTGRTICTACQRREHAAEKEGTVDDLALGWPDRAALPLVPPPYETFMDWVRAQWASRAEQDIAS